MVVWTLSVTRYSVEDVRVSALLKSCNVPARVIIGALYLQYIIITKCTAYSTQGKSESDHGQRRLTHPAPSEYLPARTSLLDIDRSEDEICDVS